jgi:Big-like domain-containing protein
VRDALSGVDPHSLTLFFGREFGTQAGPITYDEDTGIAVFSIPREANPLRPGTEFMRVFASDFQETKNINTEGTNPYPNSRFAGVRMSVVNGPAVTWISPARNACLAARARLQVVASSPAVISSVGFFDGTRQIGRVRRNTAGIYTLSWRTTGKRRGAHQLTAVASDVRGRESGATVRARVCR